MTKQPIKKKWSGKPNETVTLLREVSKPVKKHPKSKPHPMPENTSWTRSGIVLHKKRECAWFFRFVNGKREEKFVPLDFTVGPNRTRMEAE